MKKIKNIVLIGMMGAGKSSVGNLLAQKLNRKFFDTDESIENLLKNSITELFRLFGEKKFRKFEAETIKQIIMENNLVISTGGGIVEDSKNIKNLKKNGVLIYLKAEAGELFERIKNEKHRPLLKTENPKQTIKDILERREKFYQQADIVIETSGKVLENIVEEVSQKIINLH